MRSVWSRVGDGDHADDFRFASRVQAREQHGRLHLGGGFRAGDN